MYKNKIGRYEMQIYMSSMHMGELTRGSTWLSHGHVRDLTWDSWKRLDPERVRQVITNIRLVIYKVNT